MDFYLKSDILCAFQLSSLDDFYPTILFSTVIYELGICKRFHIASKNDFSYYSLLRFFSNYSLKNLSHLLISYVVSMLISVDCSHFSSNVVMSTYQKLKLLTMLLLLANISRKFHLLECYFMCGQKHH